MEFLRPNITCPSIVPLIATNTARTDKSNIHIASRNWIFLSCGRANVFARQRQLRFELPPAESYALGWLSVSSLQSSDKTEAVMIANDASSTKPIACVGFGHVDWYHYGADRCIDHLIIIIGILFPNIWTTVNPLQRLHQLIPPRRKSWGQWITSYASCCRSNLYSWKQGNRWTSPTTSSAILVIGSKNSNSWLVIFSVVVGTPTTEAHVCQSDQTNESACNSLVIDALQNTRSIILECDVQYSVIV